ncbi:MAG: TRAP transporter permease, partial [Candidatus Rokubacteria bacterium]|nr:TRAP transporter permease [Candidatus Rokubacteria bacterium]
TALEPINTVNPALAAHFFAFHFATIAAITPPVALAAYAAASLSGADPFKTGFTACRIGLIAFIVPFMFAYSPSLLFEGSWFEITSATVTASVGVACIAAATQGYLFRYFRGWARVVFLVAGLLLVKPGLGSDVVGLVLGLVAFLLGAQRSPSPEPELAGGRERAAD